MSYNVIATPDFKKLVKKLARKYPSLRGDLTKLIKTLADNPTVGTSLGHGLYKIRLAITSKGKGKSGGARVITFLLTPEKEVYLVYLYDKGQLDSISKEQVLVLLNKAGLL